jgi:hypothetical protein
MIIVSKIFIQGSEPGVRVFFFVPDNREATGSDGMMPCSGKVSDNGLISPYPL